MEGGSGCPISVELAGRPLIFRGKLVLTSDVVRFLYQRCLLCASHSVGRSALHILVSHEQGSEEAVESISKERERFLPGGLYFLTFPISRHLQSVRKLFHAR